MFFHMQGPDNLLSFKITSFRLRENSNKKKKKGAGGGGDGIKIKCKVSKGSVCSLPWQAGAGKRSMSAPSACMQDFFEIPCVAGRFKCFPYYIGLWGLPVIWLCCYQALQMAGVQRGSNQMHLCTCDQDRDLAVERLVWVWQTSNADGAEHPLIWLALSFPTWPSPCAASFCALRE